MPQCAVAACRNSHRRTRGEHIRYHRFPQLPEHVRQQWVIACGRKNKPNGDLPFNLKTARVCSLHFTDDAYERNTGRDVSSVRSRLRRGVVPTLFLRKGPKTKRASDKSNADADGGGGLVKVEPTDTAAAATAAAELATTLDQHRTAAVDINQPSTSDGRGGANLANEVVIVRQTMHSTKQSRKRNQPVAQKRFHSSQHHKQHQQQPKRKKTIDSRNTAAKEEMCLNNWKSNWKSSAYSLNGPVPPHPGSYSGMDVLFAVGLKPTSGLNKMHAMEGAGGSGRNVDAAEEVPRKDASPRASPNIPQSQQNGAALPEETAASSMAVDCVRPTTTTTTEKSHCKTATDSTKSSPIERGIKVESRETDKKRKYNDEQASTNGPSTSKKICLVGHMEDREQYISSLIACDNDTPEEFAAKALELRSEIQALDELARAKEIEWNQILQTRKLKEEAYLRVERKRQVSQFMNCSSLPEDLPSASLALGPTWESSSGDTTSISSEKSSGSKEYLSEISSQEQLPKKSKGGKAIIQRQTPPKNNGGNRKQTETLSPDNRQISEGRQGVKVDVQAIIDDYRSRHPETVPRRGRRMRNSMNVGPTTGGAVIEGGHNIESRPSSTDSCKNNLNLTEYNNSMSFKDVLVQFAKMSQQQGEPIKTPQNYPDVTLHPVPPSSMSQNNAPQQTGSLLHGILTKAQSPKPTTFSPTLARLLTAPERNSPTTAATVTASVPQQSAATQHLLQAYQGSNIGAINELLSSTKARSEITITPVVNPPASQSHSNNVIHVEDVEEETSMIDDRESKYSAGVRDSREERDNPPRCQGCKERTAQFVCAGCGNQWYCSRNCQVEAWDEHSEVCSG